MKLVTDVYNPEKVYGFVRGVVVRNDDRENRGRVKVLFQETAAYVLKNLGKDKESKWFFKQPGDTYINELGEKKSASFTSEIINTLNVAEQSVSEQQKIPDSVIYDIAGVLDWVEQASPLIGSGTMSMYSAETRTGSVVNGITQNGVPVNSSRVLNEPSVSTEPGRPNNTTALYGKPPGYNNSTCGSFSVPNVGAHVWVFFENGDITRPVYFAYSFGTPEWSSITVGNSANGSIDRKTLSKETPSGDIYTGKTVLVNEKGGVIEVCNTDHFERLSIGDHHGNYFSMHNNGITECTSVKNGTKQLIVNGDYHIDVTGNYVVNVQGEKHTVVQGYEHRVYGDPSKHVNLQQQWLEKTKLVRVSESKRRSVPNFSSAQQAIATSAVKRATNNNFNMSISLDFKVPVGKTIHAMNDAAKSVMSKIPGINKLQVPDVGMLSALQKAKDLLKKGQGLVDGVKGEVANLANYANGLVDQATSAAIKVVGDATAFTKAQLGDPMKLVGISSAPLPPDKA